MTPRSIAFAVLALGVAAGSACEPAKIIHEDIIVTVTIVGAGSVVSAPAGLSCDASCLATFDSGTQLTLQPRADAGFAFSGWSGDCAAAGVGATDGVIDIELREDIDCTLTFIDEADVVDDDDPSLTLVVVGAGSVTADAGVVTLSCGAGDTCTGHFPRDRTAEIKATGAIDADLVTFSGDCQPLGLSTAEVLMDVDRSCTATFTGTSEVTFPLRVRVEGHGRVTSSPAGIDCDEVTADCRARFTENTFVTVDAIADPGWTFVAWGDACADASFGPTLEVQLAASLACSVVFERQLSITISGGGRVESSDPAIACDASSFSCVFPITAEGLELTAVADPGHVFIGWGGECSGTSPTVTLPDNASACTALFELTPPVLTIVIEGSGAVTSTDDAINCPAGACTSEIAGTAIFDPGAWTCPIGYFGAGDGCDCGCGLPDPDCATPLASACEFTEACNGHVVVEDRNHLCYAADAELRSITLIATADDGFVFSAWQGECASTSETLTLAVAEALTCTAVFVPAMTIDLVRASPRVPADPVELAVSRDGGRVVVVADSVLVLDAETASTVRRISSPPASSSAATRATLDGDGQRLAIARADRSIELYALGETANSSSSNGGALVLSGHTSAPTALAFASTASEATGFASGDASGRVKLWSTTTGLVQRTLVPHSAAIAALMFVNDDLVLSVAGDGTVATTAANGTAIDLETAPAAALTTSASCAALPSSSGALCVVAAGDSVRLMSVDALGAITVGPTRAAPGVHDIDVLTATSAGGGTALVVLASGQARVLDLASGALTTLVSADAALAAGGAATRAVLVGDTIEIFSALTRLHALTSVPWDRIAPLGDRRVAAASSTAARPVLFFDALGAQGVRSFASAGPAIQLAAANGAAFVGTGSGVVRVNASTGTATPVLAALSPALISFAVNDAGDRLVGARSSFGSDVIVYELPVGDPFRTLVGHGSLVSDTGFAGDHVVTACGDGFVRVFSLVTGALVGSTQLAAAPPSALDANVNGIVVGAADGQLTLVDVSTGDALWQVDVGCALNDVAISFDGALAAASCTDHIVVIDVGLRAVRGRIAGAFSAVRFAPDERLLLAVDEIGFTAFALTP